MNKPQRLCLSLFLCLPALAWAQQPAAQDGAAAPSQTAPAPAQNGPALTHRPPPEPLNVGTGEGRIQLDVVVTDSKDRPVSGLTQQDFTLLDDKQPAKILSFHAFDGTAQKPDPPVQVILLLDTVNIDFHQVAFARQDIAKFLQQNGGHLAQPLSIFLFTNDGVSGQREPSTDGNALAGELDQIDSRLRTITQSQGVYGAIERFQLSIRAIASIVEAEANKPGRKLLIWVGPGWPMLSGLGFSDPSTRQQKQNFDLIVSLSTRLRESHMTLYSISAGQPNMNTLFYREFLKGVKSPSQAQNGNLDVKVLATETGGRVLGPDNDLAAQINSCVQDASAFYTLSFAPPRADKPDEYHDLKVQVAKPKLTAHATTGYYNQP